MARSQSPITLKRFLISALAIGFVVLVAGTIEVPAPVGLQGDLHATGTIVACDFRDMTRASELFFVGIRLNSAAAPYLRANPLHTEHERFEAMCDSHAKVHIIYRAKARVLGPVRFWIRDIAQDPS